MRRERYWWTSPVVNKQLYDQYQLPKHIPIVKPDPLIFVLISCSKSKLATEAPARELYTGQLFKKSVAWAERHEHPWFIISALHGLITPDQTLQPYDFTIKELRKREREGWAYRASRQLSKYAARGSHAFLIMPALYRWHIQTNLRESGITYENPVEGMGIGQQMRWLTHE